MLYDKYNEHQIQLFLFYHVGILSYLSRDIENENQRDIFFSG